MQIYKYRYQSSKPIVKVYDAQFLGQVGPCGADKNI